MNNIFLIEDHDEALKIWRQKEIKGLDLTPALWGLAKAEFGLRDFKRAKELLFRYKSQQPRTPQIYYLLGCIFEKEKEFPRAAGFYKDAIRLGFAGIEPILRLLKISYRLKEKNAIITYVTARYKEFKKRLLREKILSLEKGKRIKGLREIEKKISALENKLRKVYKIKMEVK